MNTTIQIKITTSQELINDLLKKNPDKTLTLIMNEIMKEANK
jgi:hypothetical protein